jgi:ABC-type Fe3+/spermidine/putrescine transport system ATPase subunit
LEQLATAGRPRLDATTQELQPDQEPVLQLSGVSKEFAGRRVVDRIDLTVRRGEFFTLLGPSGCGKTTTLRMVAGLERPDGGEITLRGRVVASAVARRFDPPEKRNLGMVFQSYAIWPHMTVFENVAYALEVRGVKRQHVRARVTEVLELVGLNGLEQRAATHLSGGQQQRLALSRALVYEPDLVLLDEPFSNLDARLREQMRAELKLLQQRLGVTVLFVTHDQLEALSLSDTIAVMNLGRIEQLDSPRVIYDAPASSFVRDFIGRMLLLDGYIRDVLGDGWARVQMDGLPHALEVRPGWSARAGERVKVAFRPEDVELVTETSRDDVLHAVIHHSVFLGERYELGLVLANGMEVRVQAPRTAGTWSHRQEVGVRIPEKGVTVWPA